MPLKYEVPSLDGVPEPVRPLYAQRDGKFVLDVEGVAPVATIADTTARLSEFRENNRKLLKALDAESIDAALQRAEKLSAFRDVDPSEYSRLKAKIAELEGVGIRGGDDMKRAVESAVEPLKAQLAALKSENEAKAAALARKQIEGAITGAALASGVLEQAMPDVIRRGLELFTVDQDAIVARKGDTPVLTAEGKPLSVEDWVKGLRKDASHFFKPSSGLGATGGNGRADGQYVSKIKLPSGKELDMSGIVPLS